MPLPSFYVRATWATHSGNVGRAGLTIEAADLAEAMAEAGRRIEARRSYAGKLTLEGFAPRQPIPLHPTA